jgi:hypothetical protein
LGQVVIGMSLLFVVLKRGGLVVGVGRGDFESRNLLAEVKPKL